LTRRGLVDQIVG